MTNELDRITKLEQKLRLKLEQTDLFKDWQSVKKTMALLSLETSVIEAIEPPEPATGNRLEVPNVYNESLSWRERVYFAISQIKSGFISDIIKELRKHGVKENDDFLNKRISTTASKLKSDGYLIGKKHGKQAKYSIKQ